jgi:pimeloyl-ACP methyl ester carboxylesterase
MSPDDSSAQIVRSISYRIIQSDIRLLAIVLFLVSACATPVGVSHVDEQEAQRELTANVLSTGRPSAYSMQILQRSALSKRFNSQPEVVLAQLNSELGKPDEHDRLFALSELSFAHAENSGSQSYYLGSAAYAYAFLFPANPADAPDSYDPRLRIAVDIYNQGIAKGLATRVGSEEVDLRARQLNLPFGTLSLAVNPRGFKNSRYYLTNFVSLADFKVRGLRNTYRKAGIGAALSAKAEPRTNARMSRWFPPTARVLVTAFVRFDDPRRAMSDGRLSGTVEIYYVNEEPAIQIDSYLVPLESDTTVALAYRLEGSPIWDFEIAGFRRGDFSIFGKSSGEDSDALYFVRPYSPDLIPVVFVHGTASSPARWAEMTNELLADPVIASRYQLWFFVYDSGNPIALSSMRLRESLQAARNDLDPEARDSGFDQMVVIGHSQGGLLAKMTVVNSGNLFWHNLSNIPFDEAKLDPKTRDLLRRAMFVRPLPFVKTIIFIATPHRGSFLASDLLVKLGNKLINLPGGFARSAVEIAKLRRPSVLGTPYTIPTALDNMDASNPFLKSLASMPIAAGVNVHSIIPVKGTGPPQDGNDGLVKYRSAHLEGVESELVVRSGHSTQSTPETIEEVRRILYQNSGIH